MQHQRYAIDVNVPALHPALSSAWIGQNTLSGCDPSVLNHGKRHGWLALIWCLSGRTRHVPSSRIRYQRDHLTILPPWTDLTHQVEPPDAVRIRYVTLRGPMIDRWLASLTWPTAAGAVRGGKSNKEFQVTTLKHWCCANQLFNNHCCSSPMPTR